MPTNEGPGFYELRGTDAVIWFDETPNGGLKKVQASEETEGENAKAKTGKTKE